MFQFLGEIIGILLMVGFGWFGFFKPERLVGCEGTPDELQKRVRRMKSSCLLLLIAGTLSLLLFAVSLFVEF